MLLNTMVGFSLYMFGLDLVQVGLFLVMAILDATKQYEAERKIESWGDKNFRVIEALLPAYISIACAWLFFDVLLPRM